MLKPVSEIDYNRYIKSSFDSLVESIDCRDIRGTNINFGKLLGISLFLTGDSRVLVDSIIDKFIENPLLVKKMNIFGSDL